MNGAQYGSNADVLDTEHYRRRREPCLSATQILISSFSNRNQKPSGKFISRRKDEKHSYSGRYSFCLAKQLYETKYSHYTRVGIDQATAEDVMCAAGELHFPAENIGISERVRHMVKHYQRYTACRLPVCVYGVLYNWCLTFFEPKKIMLKRVMVE